MKSSAYPSGRWKYIVPGAPSFLPATVMYTCLPAFDETVISEQLTTHELVQPEPVPPSGAAEVEALFAPFEFEPGKQASRTRRIAYDGPVGNCEASSQCGTISITGSVTITVTSPGGNNGEREHGRAGGRGKGGKAKGEGKGNAGERRRSEARREQLKRQTREDLTPALESAWAAHGLSAALGIAGGVGIGEVASNLSGGPVSVYGEGAIGRIAADYRIAKDPPASGFTRLAEPKRAQPRELPSCAPYTGEASSYCESLRGAETKLLLSSDTVLAIDEAMYTTIARESGAMRAGDYGAGSAQAKHFGKLHASFEAALTREGRGGSAVATLLKEAGVDGAVSKTQARADVSWLERELGKKSISAASVRALGAGHGLVPRATNVLGALAKPAG